MYKTSTFITSLFSKFRVRDKEIRKQIVELYRPLIDTILNDVPSTKRVIVFKQLLPSVQLTISCLQHLQTIKLSDIDRTTIMQALKTNVSFSYYLVRKVGIRSDSSGSFEHIMKQVNLDDIACEIGDCLQMIKTTEDSEVLTDTNSRLEVLLNDYNIVTGHTLTIDDIMSR